MKYTKETKVYVVKRYLAGEKADELIKEIGLSRSTIYLWVKQFNEETLKKENQISVCNYRKLQNKVKRLEEMVKIYKKVNCHYNSPLKVKLYALEELYGQHSIHILCDTFDIARGTFYNHILRNKKANTIYVKRKEELKEIIQKVYDENNQIFGAGKIAVILKEKGIKTSEKTISLLMREMGIKSIRLEAKKSLWQREKAKTQFTSTTI